MENGNETPIETVVESNAVLLNEHLGFWVSSRDTLL
jgi:hypothetical protein